KESGTWDLSTFRWEGIDWVGPVMAQRAAWIVAPLLITLAAAARFDRFDTQRLARYRAPRRLRALHTAAESQPAESGWDVVESRVVASLSPLPVAAGRDGAALLRCARILRAELRLMTAGLSRWWYLVLAGLLAASVLTPLEAARSHVLPLL